MRRAFAGFILIAVAACSSGRPKLEYSGASAPDWLTPRANDANTGRIVSGINNEPYTILWSTKTGGVAACEPIVRDGLIFFSGLDRRVEVYDASTGERKFRKRFDGPVLGVIAGDSTFGILVDQIERKFFTFDLRTAREIVSFKVPTATAPPRMMSDSTILLETWDGHVICFTREGREIWNTECEGPIMNPPAISDSTIYVASGRSVFALNARDGSKMWEHGFSGAIKGAPAIGGGVYFGATDSSATALEAVSGELIWSTRLGGGMFTTPTIGDDLVYFATNDGLINALGKADGVVRWTYETGAIANLSPTLCGDYLLTTSRQTAVAMLSAISGERLWIDSTLSSQAITSPVVVGDRILLTDSRRMLICLAPASQARIAVPAD